MYMYFVKLNLKWMMMTLWYTNIHNCVIVHVISFSKYTICLLVIKRKWISVHIIFLPHCSKDYKGVLLNGEKWITHQVNVQDIDYWMHELKFMSLGMIGNFDIFFRFLIDPRRKFKTGQQWQNKWKGMGACQGNVKAVKCCTK